MCKIQTDYMTENMEGAIVEITYNLKVKKKIKSCLCCVVETWRGRGITPLFLTSALDDELSSSRLRPIYPPVHIV
jgi:hypothetical protein